jgi:hypothetical protein
MLGNYPSSVLEFLNPHYWEVRHGDIVGEVLKYSSNYP